MKEPAGGFIMFAGIVSHNDWLAGLGAALWGLTLTYWFLRSLVLALTKARA